MNRLMIVLLLCAAGSAQAATLSQSRIQQQSPQQAAQQQAAAQQAANLKAQQAAQQQAAQQAAAQQAANLKAQQAAQQQAAQQAAAQQAAAKITSKLLSPSIAATTSSNFSTAGSTPAIGTPRASISGNVVKAVSSAAQTPAGKFVTKTAIDTTETAADAFVSASAPGSTAIKSLGVINSGTAIVSGAQAGGTVGGLTAAYKDQFTSAAGEAGEAIAGPVGAAAAAGTAALSFDIGQPIGVAAGGVLYNAAPGLFRPPPPP